MPTPYANIEPRKDLSKGTISKMIMPIPQVSLAINHKPFINPVECPLIKMFTASATKTMHPRIPFMPKLLLLPELP